MKRTAFVFGMLALLGLMVGCSSNCKTQAYGAAPTDFMGNTCDQPVYPGKQCLEIHPAVKGFFGNLHEKVFNCEPDPVIQAAPPCPPPPCPLPAAPAPTPCPCPGR